MFHLQVPGVKTESVVTFTIDIVAYDGQVESLWMGRVNSQLMGTSRVGEEVHARSSVRHVQNFIIRHGRLPIFPVYFLHGSVHIVRLQRQIDRTVLILVKVIVLALQQCCVSFLDGSLDKLFLQLFVRFTVLGHE